MNDLLEEKQAVELGLETPLSAFEQCILTVFSLMLVTVQVHLHRGQVFLHNCVVFTFYFTFLILAIVAMFGMNIPERHSV